MERHLLRAAVTTCSLVPIGAGFAGVLLGPTMVASAIGTPTDLDSHFRYLSGLLLGIGLGFVSTIPRIEERGNRFRLLTAIVVAGGIGRLISILANGPGSLAMRAALAMELLVTPGLACWQWRVARMERD
jgi:Domain of unknown function (DUF4345)